MLAALAGADAASIVESAPIAEQGSSSRNVMLHLDDELAGLVEAADMPADQARAHSTKPEPVSPMSGELPGVQSMSPAAVFADFTVASALAVLCNEVQCTSSVRCSTMAGYVSLHALQVLSLPDISAHWKSCPLKAKRTHWSMPDS